MIVDALPHGLMMFALGFVSMFSVLVWRDRHRIHWAPNPNKDRHRAYPTD